MIESRDVGFWRSVADHPEVKPHIALGREFDIADVVSNPMVRPLRFEHGGFLFVQLDGLGRVHELHTLFTPDGWGREVLLALKQACEEILSKAQVITTYEVEGNWRSRPPKTFRFQAAGDFEPCALGSFKTWILTKSDWLTSPARRSM